MHSERARSLKANPKQYNVNIFGDGPARDLITGREIDEEVIGGLLLVQKMLETNVSGLLFRVGWWRLKNHSLNLLGKQD